MYSDQHTTHPRQISRSMTTNCDHDTAPSQRFRDALRDDEPAPGSTKVNIAPATDEDQLTTCRQPTHSKTAVIHQYL